VHFFKTSLNTFIFILFRVYLLLFYLKAYFIYRQSVGVAPGCGEGFMAGQFLDSSWVQRVRIFITEDLPGLEEAIKRIFPKADWQLCVLYEVRDVLNKSRKKDREETEEAFGACGSGGKLKPTPFVSIYIILSPSAATFIPPPTNSNS